MNKLLPHNNPLGPALGLAAFDSLRAEDEPWLSRGFVPPPHIEQISGDRSVIVFGGPGSGKTALNQFLKRLCLDRQGAPLRLVAEWTPSPLTIKQGLKGIETVRAQTNQVLDACVESILHFVAGYPDRFHNAPETAKESLAWFVKEYSQSDLSLRIEQLIEDEQPPGVEILKTLLTTKPRRVLPPGASPDKVAARLVRTLQTMEINGVWVLGNDDELEMWVDVDPDELIANLQNLFSTLPLFERANFSYKLLLPSWLEQRTLGVVQRIRLRQRIFPYYLNHWQPKNLHSLVNLRLSIATGQPNFTLNNLCTSPKLRSWLEWVGAASPREWLEQVKPLIEYYLANSCQQPINPATWEELRLANPPRLYLDDDRKHITVGARPIPLQELPAKAYEMLRFLYQQPSDQVTSREALYYHIYRNLDYIPQPGDTNYEGPAEYRGAIDTSLWRLRNAIEPDMVIEPDKKSRDLVLLVTVRGHGVKLNTRW
ncbi:MAG: hypothetical protein KDJ65_10550 [Anaerolineae bacterium]|nr:hypothetical protein [Anaerolineae bacterium]